jgi:hypothetical protein
MMSIKCEHCNEDIGSVEVSHSAVAVLQYVDTSGYQFFQCEQGQDYAFMNWQHFHCSHAHMKQNFAKCVIEHYTEAALHPIPIGAGSTILHKIVLGSNLSCKICKSLLTNQAYRFCLTHATPVNKVPDESLNELGEWCCSVDHAKQSALAIIQIF